MIFKEKEEKYLFILTIAITLVSGPLQLSSSSCAFYDINTIEQQQLLNYMRKIILI